MYLQCRQLQFTFCPVIAASRVFLKELFLPHEERSTDDDSNAAQHAKHNAHNRPSTCNGQQVDSSFENRTRTLLPTRSMWWNTLESQPSEKRCWERHRCRRLWADLLQGDLNGSQDNATRTGYWWQNDYEKQLRTWRLIVVTILASLSLHSWTDRLNLSYARKRVRPNTRIRES